MVAAPPLVSDPSLASWLCSSATALEQCSQCSQCSHTNVCSAYCALSALLHCLLAHDFCL
ncbi:MAG TPA: hypothetical protein DIS95_06300 [Proteus vulgaris]|nr:hypothetical protein [Proteus vulgaris]